MKKIYIAIVAFGSALCSSHAVTVSFSAVGTNGVGDSDGNDLALSSSVELGIWTGSFTALNTFDVIDTDFGAATVTGSSFGLAGEFSATTDAINTNGLSINGSQLAIRWTESDGDFGIAYSTLSNWILAAGDGSGSDTATNSIDLGDLTDGASTLLGTAVIQVGSLGGTSTTFEGTALFQTQAVPEPSAYGAIAGFLALGAVMFRRRRA